MDPSSSTATFLNKLKTQLDENANCGPPKKHKNVSKMFVNRKNTATNFQNDLKMQGVVNVSSENRQFGKYSLINLGEQTML